MTAANTGAQAITPEAETIEWRLAGLRIPKGEHDELAELSHSLYSSNAVVLRAAYRLGMEELKAKIAPMDLGGRIGYVIAMGGATAKAESR